MTGRELSTEEVNMIANLKASGFVVIVWTPDEIGKADTDGLEEVSVERGWNYINDLNGPESDEEAE